MVGPSKEELRSFYRPERIVLLFVGESPPAGPSFFYEGNSHLFRYTRQAFAEALGGCGSAAEFLEGFKDCGCYLDDLCLEPVNRTDGAVRRRLRREGIACLAERMKQYGQPEAIVIVKVDIERHVAEAARIAALDPVPRYILPFPAHGHHGRYVALLINVLLELRASGKLPCQAGAD